jgi:hypothetical protein
MTKNIIKYAAGGVGVVIAALGVIWGIGYWRMTHDPEYVRSREGERIMDEWKKMYADDTYGGDTPEETLRLFIDALKRGDTDLASKYFVVDEWEKQRQLLDDLKKSPTGLVTYISDISAALHGKKTLPDNETVRFEYMGYVDKPSKIRGTNLIIPPGNFKSSLTLQKIYSLWKIAH